jgi:hypothetical protein
VATDSTGRLGGQPIHEKQRRFLHVLRNMIHIIDHARGVHPFDGAVIGSASPPAGSGSVFVRVDDREGRNVNTIGAQRQRDCVTKLVTSFENYSIAPNYEMSDEDQMQDCQWQAAEGAEGGPKGPPLV